MTINASNNLISGSGILIRAHKIVIQLRPSTVPLLNFSAEHLKDEMIMLPWHRSYQKT
jgi:hypothetical protein